MEEKTIYGNGPVYLKFLTAEQYEQLNSPTCSSVHCFPIKDNEILFTINPRGLDIIGGHVEKGETPEQALIRESKEEACIIPINFKLIGAIQVDNRDNPDSIKKGYPEKGYQLFYVVSEYETLDFKVDFESTGRKYIKPEDIKQQHHNWLNTHQTLVEHMFELINTNSAYKKMRL